MNHTEARAFLQEHMTWMLNGCQPKSDLREYRAKLEMALLKIQEPEIREPLIRRIVVDPEGDMDELGEFLENFTEGAEYGDYMSALGYMWHHAYQYSDENPDLERAMEKEIRLHVKSIRDDWRLVTTFSASGVSFEEYMSIDNMSQEMFDLMTRLESDSSVEE